MPLEALGDLLRSARKWEREEIEEKIERRLFPLWAIRRAVHSLKGGSDSTFISYEDFINQTLNNGAQSAERRPTTPAMPARSGEDIINDLKPYIEADRRRQNG